MLLIVILFIAQSDALGLERPSDLLKYLTKYEVAECEIIKDRGLSNLQERTNETSVRDIDVEILLRAYKKTFHLVLFEDEAFGHITIQVQGLLKYNNSKHTARRTTFYIGALKNRTSQSFVTGFVINDTFSGYIMEGNIEYLVEPAKFFLPNSTTSQNIMYKMEDTNSWNASSSDSLYPLDLSLSYRTSNITRNATIVSEGIDLDSHSNYLFCEMEIVADHELYYYFRNDSDHLSAYLYFHVKYADKIFRQTDFTMDAKPDGVRLSIAKISIYTSPNDYNYPMATSLDITDYLTKYVYRQQESEFCLSVSMLFRDFASNAIGEAFRPDVNSPHIVGGICDKPLLRPKSGRFHKQHYNIAAINLCVGGHLLPLAITTVAVTHEVGHSFGSGHDLPTQRTCSPPKPFGKYLMYPSTLPSSQQRMQFSPCSRLIMGETIRKKGWCLKRKSTVCGNDIREGEQECDRGRETACNFIDYCCTLSDAQPPERVWTIKKQIGFECSPKESICCHRNCTTVKNTSLQCYSNHKQHLKSYCDGFRLHCSEPRKDLLANCKWLMTSCVEKNCHDTICGKKGLQGCTCGHDAVIECLLCCINKDNRVPAGDLGILNSKDANYVLQSGTGCNGGIFQCDNLGNCLDLKHHSNYVIEPLYVSLAILSVIAIGILSIMLYFYRKKIKIDNLLLLRNHI